MHPGLRLTIVLALSACYVVGRLAMLALPGISLSYLVLAVSALAFGPRVGATVGALGRLASDLAVSGLNPVFVPMVLVDALLGALIGGLGRVVNLGQRGLARGLFPRLVLFNMGLWMTVAYSVLADTTTWLYYNFVLTAAPDAARSALWGTLVLTGLLFNIPAVVFNAIVFPATVPPLLRNLHEAGLLPERAQAPVVEPASEPG